MFYSVDPCSSPGHSMMQFPPLPVACEDPPGKGPPPLPPRHRGTSTSQEVPPPTPPPRPIDNSDKPPPVPPRRDSMPCHNSAASLGRSQSVSHPRNSQSFSGSNTMPRPVERHSSERSFPINSIDLPNSHTEDAGERPELPPRTYRSQLNLNRHPPPRDS